MFVIFSFLCSAGQIMSLSGCIGNKNIPPASIAESGKITLSWNAIPGASSYNVYFSTSPGVTKLNGFRIPNAANPITITDLEPGTTYYFIVTVVNELGESEESNEMSYTVMDTAGFIDFKDLSFKSIPEDKALESKKEQVAPAPEKKLVRKKPDHKSLEPKKEQVAPAPEKKLVKKKPEPLPPHVGTDKKVTLAWDNVPNATSYNIYWDNSPGITKKSAKKISNVKNPHTIKGLKPGTTYYFVVTSVNELGESEVSEEISYTVAE
jgi:predicted phage tail protein